MIRMLQTKTSTLRLIHGIIIYIRLALKAMIHYGILYQQYADCMDAFLRVLRTCNIVLIEIPFREIVSGSVFPIDKEFYRTSRIQAKRLLCVLLALILPIHRSSPEAPAEAIGNG